MWKKLLFNILLNVAVWASNKVIDLIDTDEDGEISQEEIEVFVRNIKNLFDRI